MIMSTKNPQSTEEAFEIIDKMLTNEEKCNAIKQKASTFSSEQHFGLGLWVRNNWIFNGNVPVHVLTGEEPIDDEAPCYIHTTPDDISSRFTTLYHKHLKKTFKP